MEYRKTQSVAKLVHAPGPKLSKIILDTMKTISDIVGATLGPGGRPVLIERFESGMPSSVTKDGVTVFKALGFENATEHCIMEASRDAAVRTATIAGDGTTTCCILSESIVRYMSTYCQKHPRVSPQRILRRLETIFRDIIEPQISGLSKLVEIDSLAGKEILHAVAKISANGDTALADAVMQCFEISGDEGNVTITDASGPSGYSVEKINGYLVATGFTDSCAGYSSQFINDAGNNRTYLEKPIFILYHGRITEVQTIQTLLEKVGSNWQEAEEQGEFAPHNVVLVATGFSDSVLAGLALNFSITKTVKVVPVLLPLSPQIDGQLELLHDLSAVTGASILDPLTASAEQADVSDLGPGVEGFEFNRTKCSIFGYADESLLMIRIDELNQRLNNPESQLDAILLRERKAKLSGGIAKLRVSSASYGEMKEKRDRAEDAVCAVRGAIKHGTLPGGGWTLLKLNSLLPDEDVCNEILKPAFAAPFLRLLSNCGILDEEEGRAILAPILEGLNSGDSIVYDFLEQKHVNAYQKGILDSTPAVLEAIRASISIAALLGTLGGTIVFARDEALEQSEAVANADFLRNSSVNEANERM
jgi:chaperonin GroEL